MGTLAGGRGRVEAEGVSLPRLEPPRPLLRQNPARRPRRKQPPAKRKRGLGWRGKLVAGVVIILVALLGAGAVARHIAPTENTERARFDAIIVLGYPADADGNPTPRQLARVSEAVREYNRGVAPRLILTGGAAHNRYTEAEVMARTAEAQGIPESAIFLEPKAQDTIQNACYAVRILKQHGWDSAEVISSSSHLPRAGLIFNELPVEWRAHVAPPMEPETPLVRAAERTLETVNTVRYLVYARWVERCEP